MDKINHRKPCRGRVRRGGRGFTLIELLVVVVIFAVLMAILLPALGLAKESGRRTQCLANLRSLGQATFMYADASGNRMPNGNSEERWLDYTGTGDVLPKLASGYLTSPRAFFCPSDKDAPPQAIENADHNGANSARVSYDYYAAYWPPELGPYLDRIPKAAIWWDLDGGAKDGSDVQNHGKGGGHVVFADAHASWQPTENWQADNWPLEAHLNYPLIDP